MRTLFFIFMAAFLVSCGSGEPKATAVNEPQPSSNAPQTATDRMMLDYYRLSEAFVNWDSSAVRQGAAQLHNDLNLISNDLITRDSSLALTASTSIAQASGATDSISTASSIATGRIAFNNLTQNIFDLLRTIRYDRSKIYLQKCPMAFNEKEPGFWLTGKGADSIRNPYLGLHDPKYGDAMIDCGENSATIDFTPVPEASK